MALTEVRKYRFKNITKSDMVHVKELRKALSPGKEAEWEGVLNPNTQRLIDQKLLDVKDLGPGSKNEERKAFAASREEADVHIKKVVKDLQRPVRNGVVEEVKASDFDVEPVTAVEPVLTVEKAEDTGPVEVEAQVEDLAEPEPEEPVSRLDSLISGKKKKRH